jgi:hypothetical protein
MCLYVSRGTLGFCSLWGIIGSGTLTKLHLYIQLLFIYKLHYSAIKTLITVFILRLIAKYSTSKSYRILIQTINKI